MRVRLDYGRSGLEVELPDRNVVKCLGFRAIEPLADPAAAVRASLEEPIGALPLAELARGRRNACVVINDITRPAPNALLLPPVLETVEQSGIARREILILVATGLHRGNTPDELVEMLGPAIAAGYRIENHCGQRREDHCHLGTSPRGVPIWIDRRYVEADLKITVGLIEPHFMAGFSGGRKLVCPGLAALETIKVWHGPSFIEHPRARTGVIEGNPLHEENTWIARRAGCDFIVNAVIDAGRRVLTVVAGDMEQAWLEGTELAGRLASDTVPQPVDIVVTSAAGYPLDATYYQSIKGMVAAEPIVRPGGTIILAAAMSEGIGSPEFRRIFQDHPTLEGFMEAILSGSYWAMDQWQVEELAVAARKARIVVVTGGLPAATLRAMYVEAAESVESAVSDALARHGPEATIAVIPKGPYVVAGIATGTVPFWLPVSGNGAGGANPR